MPSIGPDQRDQRARNRRPRRRPQGATRPPVSEFDEMQEIEAARERNDLNISDLGAMSEKELRAVGQDLELEAEVGVRREELVDRILQAPDRTRRPRLRDRDPRHRRRGLRVHAPPRPAAEPGRRLRLVEPGPPVRPPDRRPGVRRGPRPARGREVLGPPPGRLGQRRRSRARPPAGRTSATRRRSTRTSCSTSSRTRRTSASA